MIRKIYIAATNQNVGKTTMAIGLYNFLQDQGCQVGFIKPIGQHFVEVDNKKIDEDAILVHDVFQADTLLADMGPIAVARGFTEEFILHGNRAELEKRIMDSFGRISQGKDAVIIEGTGHAGVGSTFSLSNADVAHRLEAPVILVASGGIGRTIDEVFLNLELFERRKVKLLGIIVNKVLPDKYERIKSILAKAFRDRRVKLLGVIPFFKSLTFPSLKQLVDGLKLKVLIPGEDLRNRIENIVVAAMSPQNAIGYFKDKTLVITPGDRIDNLLVSLSAHLLKGPNRFSLSGIVLTGGFIPHFSIMSLLKDSKVTVLSTPQDTFSFTQELNNLMFKIGQDDPAKIDLIKEAFRKYIDLKSILASLALELKGSIPHA